MLQKKQVSHEATTQHKNFLLQGKAWQWGFSMELPDRSVNIFVLRATKSLWQQLHSAIAVPRQRHGLKNGLAEILMDDA